MPPIGTLHTEARLVPSFDLLAKPRPTSWFITHPLGGPAANTFTEVQMPDFTPDGEKLEESVLDAAVRQIAMQLYGTAYAFTYRPGQYADSIARHRMTRRELVLVSVVEVWGE
jgi:hypothetical protein